MPSSSGHGKEKHSGRHSAEQSSISQQSPNNKQQDHHHSKHERSSKRKGDDSGATDKVRHKTKRYEEVEVKQEPQDEFDRRSTQVKEEPPNAFHRDNDSRHHSRSQSHGHHRDHSGAREGENLRQQRRERFDNDRRRLEHRGERRVKQEADAGPEEWGSANNPNAEGSANPADKKEKEKPTLELSGKLAEDTNTFRGVVIKYNEPEEARKPKKRWRFHPFKGDEALPILHLHRQSAFLLGRDRRVADIPVDHPSCSKQHAALQFRLVPYSRPDGGTGRRVSPYVIDLGSANGTYVNNQRIESQRYVELFEKDVIKFGFSSRDYVLLHDGSDTSVLAGDDEGADE